MTCTFRIFNFIQIPLYFILCDRVKNTQFVGLSIFKYDSYALTDLGILHCKFFPTLARKVLNEFDNVSELVTTSLFIRNSFSIVSLCFCLPIKGLRILQVVLISSLVWCSKLLWCNSLAFLFVMLNTFLYILQCMVAS